MQYEIDPYMSNGYTRLICKLLPNADRGNSGVPSQTHNTCEKVMAVSSRARPQALLINGFR